MQCFGVLSWPLNMTSDWAWKEILVVLICVKNFCHLLCSPLCCFILCAVSCCGDALCRDTRVGKSFNVETLIITNSEHEKLYLNLFGNLLTAGSCLIHLRIKTLKKIWVHLCLKHVALTLIWCVRCPETSCYRTLTRCRHPEQELKYGLLDVVWAIAQVFLQILCFRW